MPLHYEHWHQGFYNGLGWKIRDFNPKTNTLGWSTDKKLKGFSEHQKELAYKTHGYLKALFKIQAKQYIKKFKDSTNQTHIDNIDYITKALNETFEVTLSDINTRRVSDKKAKETLYRAIYIQFSYQLERQGIKRLL